MMNFLCSIESRGTGAHLMKVGSKRRRTKMQIEEEKADALTKQQAIEEKLAFLETLVQENAALKAKQEGPNEAELVLSQMLEAGYVQRDGEGNWGPG